MSCLPVVIRELRAQARQPFTYWMRVAGATAVVVVFAIAALGNEARAMAASQFGEWLFAALNGVLVAAIWLLVPLLTADCISREQREGTLGLLFLTPLTPGAIVIGKGIIHALRAFSMLLAVLPVMALSFVFGGVSWEDAVTTALLDLAAVMVALAAGLLASSWSRDGVRAVVLAEILSVVLGWSFMAVHYLGYGPLIWRFGRWPRALSLHPELTTVAYAWKSFWEMSFSDLILDPIRYFSSTVSFLDVPVGFFTTAPALKLAHVWWSLALAGLAFCILRFVLALAAWRIRRSWHAEPAGPRQLWLLRVFCTPRYWQGMFRGKMSRTLERNPIGWLQEYTWSARLIKWGWCLFIIVVECLLVSDPSLENLATGQYWLGALVLLSLGFSAAGSFREERQSGALELLLVTPLRVSQIIGGRLRGVWSQFLPAMFFLAVVQLYILIHLQAFLFNADNDPSAIALICMLSSYIAVPVVGLCCSMRRWNFLAAWLATVVGALGLPLFVTALAAGNGMNDGLLLFSTAQAILALAAWWALHRQLAQRRFVLT